MNRARPAETQGLDATLAHYNREGSVDGQWYVVIIDENDLVIGHPEAHRLGLDLRVAVTKTSASDHMALMPAGMR